MLRTISCSPGIGAGPQQTENAQIRRSGNAHFSHMARHSIACHYYTKFGIKVASNASVIQMRKTHLSPFQGTGGFLLAEAPPQAPVIAVCPSAAARFSIAFVFA